MAVKPVVLTLEGLERLEHELDFLRTVKRKEVAEKIKTALSFGDLSENAEYDEAKNEQAQMEARIQQIEIMLKNAKVIDDEDVTTDVVSLGSKVKIYDCDYEETIEYVLVGSTEANPSQHKISDESPIGRALIGHGIGEEVEVNAPAGILKIKILEISK